MLGLEQSNPSSMLAAIGTDLNFNHSHLSFILPNVSPEQNLIRVCCMQSQSMLHAILSLLFFASFLLQLIPLPNCGIDHAANGFRQKKDARAIMFDSQFTEIH